MADNQNQSRTANKPRILLINSDLVFRRLLMHLLELEGGFEVVECVGEQSAVMRISEGKPDIILLGVKLDDAGAPMLLKRLKENPTTRDIPVILTTDRENHPLLEEALGLGADDFISKPMVGFLLVKRIRALLGGKSATPASSVTGAPATPDSHPPPAALVTTAPLKKAPDAQSRKSAAQPSEERGERPAPSKRILVVEDTSIMRKILTRTIERYGNFELIEAETGAEALDKLNEFTFNLILLDITLPDINGLDLLEKIKENPLTVAVPVIMVTAHRDKPTIDRAISAGIADYIIKPINTSSLMKKVRGALGITG